MLLKMLFNLHDIDEFPYLMERNFNPLDFQSNH